MSPTLYTYIVKRTDDPNLPWGVVNRGTSIEMGRYATRAQARNAAGALNETERRTLEHITAAA